MTSAKEKEKNSKINLKIRERKNRTQYWVLQH